MPTIPPRAVAGVLLLTLIDVGLMLSVGWVLSVKLTWQGSVVEIAPSVTPMLTRAMPRKPPGSLTVTVSPL